MKRRTCRCRSPKNARHGAKDDLAVLGKTASSTRPPKAPNRLSWLMDPRGGQSQREFLRTLETPLGLGCWLSSSCIICTNKYIYIIFINLFIYLYIFIPISHQEKQKFQMRKSILRPSTYTDLNPSPSAPSPQMVFPTGMGTWTSIATSWCDTQGNSLWSDPQIIYHDAFLINQTCGCNRIID